MIPIYLLSNDQPFRVDYLVIAGGGGGGGRPGGGGGAGGYLCSVPSESSGGPSTRLETVEFIGGQALTLTVGAGGGTNLNGANSVFGEVVAVGGGKGGTDTLSAKSAGDGGSGGGSQPISGQPGGDGTTNQGNDGGTGFQGGNLPQTFEAGAGGGATEAGNTDGQGEGGDGIASSITGTSIIRAGGGGGDRGNYGSVHLGGSGGGGNGGRGDLRDGFTQAPTAGAINTGGGGGGGGSAGGSGVVVLRYPSLARIIDFIDPGLTYEYSDDGTFKRYVFKSGTGSIRF